MSTQFINHLTKFKPNGLPIKGKHHWAFVYAVFNCMVASALRFMSKVKAAGTK